MLQNAVSYNEFNHQCVTLLVIKPVVKSEQQWPVFTLWYISKSADMTLSIYLDKLIQWVHMHITDVWKPVSRTMVQNVLGPTQQQLCNLTNHNYMN